MSDMRASRQILSEFSINGCSRLILLKNALHILCVRKWAADVEIRANADTELLQISCSNASIGRFFGFVQANRDGTDFFNRIGQ